MRYKSFTKEDLKPSWILHYILNDGFVSAKDYTYIICGRSGPTGKTWLCHGLKHHGFNAVELSEDLIGLVDYLDNKNHFIIKALDKTVLIVLNEFVIELK